MTQFIRKQFLYKRLLRFDDNERVKLSIEALTIYIKINYKNEGTCVSLRIQVT